MLKGKSFGIDTSKLDGVLSKVKNADKQANKILERRMQQATDIVWRIAHAKRPMISAAQAKAEGRTSRVSNPGASAGVPVRTGALQASIKQKTSLVGGKWQGRVWTSGVPYAGYVEFGTSKMAARPFMRPAVELSKDALKLLFGKKE